VRFAGLVVLALMVVIACLALGGAGEDAAGRCARQRCVTIRLPAPITISVARVRSGSVSYRVARDGRVSPLANTPSPYPRDATWFPGTATWFAIRDRSLAAGRALGRRGYLLVGRGRRLLWRSHEQLAAKHLGVIAAGEHAVAFQRQHRLYIASYGAAARPVARRELPLGWTTGGLYTYSYPRRELLLRDEHGMLEKVISRGALEYEFDVESGRLYFISRGLLMSADSARVRRLASLNSLGMSPNTYVQPLGRVVELLDDRRLAVVRPGGSLFASTQVRTLDRISSFLAIAPDASAIAFTGVTGPTTHPNAENVYLLRAGAHAAVAVHHEPGSFIGCAQGASIQWHRNWLLYSNNDGKLSAIDTHRGHRTIELSGIVRRLHYVPYGLTAHWSW
jgi:hypothetical protein